MTSAIAHAFNPPQLEAANLLNLVIVDDERAVRDVCREVAQSLGFNTMVAESAEHYLPLARLAGRGRGSARLEIAGRRRNRGTAQNQAATPGCRGRRGYRLRHRAIGCAGYEKRGL